MSSLATLYAIKFGDIQCLLVLFFSIAMAC
jgi:hypothetical protein